MWLEQKFDLLIQEAEKCDKKLPRSCSNITDEQAIKIFSRLMLEGKIREATRFITEREESGGIMSPGDDAGKPKDRTVMEVLLSKQPEQANPDEEAFIECEELPEFLYVEVTSSHVQRVAKKLTGGAGPSGLASGTLQDMLLKFKLEITVLI